MRAVCTLTGTMKGKATTTANSTKVDQCSTRRNGRRRRRRSARREGMVLEVATVLQRRKDVMLTKEDDGLDAYNDM